MTFNQLDDLISQIYKEVDVRHEDRVDFLVEKLADALYEDLPGRMLMILEEFDAERLIRNSFFYEKLVKGIEDYINATGNYAD